MNNPNDQSELYRALAQADSADGTEGVFSETIDAEVLLHRQASPRKRAVQVGLALLCLLVVVGLLHATAPLPTPQSASPSLARMSTSDVMILTNLSYGSVMVDGKKLVGKPPFSFYVAPAGDSVIYSAPPFTPLTCRVYWTGTGTSAQLGAVGSNCQINSTLVTVSDQVSSSYVLNFQFGLDLLPAALQATAVDIVR